MRDSHVAANIRTELTGRSIPQYRIARLLGLSGNAVSRRMRGEVPFRADELVKIADHLGVDVASLFTEESA